MKRKKKTKSDQLEDRLVAFLDWWEAHRLDLEKLAQLMERLTKFLEWMDKATVPIK